MDTNTDKRLGTLLDDRYELTEVIGAGGMAIVYKAMCHRLNRYVAVKILRDELLSDDEFRQRFQTEAQAVAMLSHPNIVSVYDVSHSDDVEYIVMELIEGITLKQYMKKKGNLGWKEAMHFASQICKALEHAHEKGIIHRDIKPQNIMILKDGGIKVADFGIAALESSAEQKSPQAIGSIHYMAPEQAKGEVPDARCDIYSLGVVMYEMLTGKPPYEGDTTEDVAHKHMEGGAPAPIDINPEVPAILSEITMKAMCPDIDRRYRSATELLKALDDFRNGLTAPVAAVVAADNQEQEPVFVIRPDVYPIGDTGEMTREKYLLRRQRSRKVSVMFGAFGVLVFIIAVFISLWNYWLKDIFNIAERISVPDFVGENYETIVNNTKDFKNFKFKVVYDIDPDVEEGIIISQNPEANRSMMVIPEGITVELTVSTGIKQAQVPDVVNWQYQEATLELQNAGFLVEAIVEASDTVTEDYVISTKPAAGYQLGAGSWVYIYVSAGPTLMTVTMPNLIGITENTARSRIASSNLAFGSVEYVHSDYEAGVVIRQSLEAYSEVQEHTKIYIWVSLGPESTPSPSPAGTIPPSEAENGG